MPILPFQGFPYHATTRESSRTAAGRVITAGWTTDTGGAGADPPGEIVSGSAEIEVISTPNVSIGITGVIVPRRIAAEISQASCREIPKESGEEGVVEYQFVIA
jgi:hypothetical protein